MCNELDMYINEDDDNESPLGDSILRSVIGLPCDFDFEVDDE